jgi:hypothetical protein
MLPLPSLRNPSCTCIITPGVRADILKSVGAAITALPENFTPHRQIKKVYEARRAMIESGGVGSSKLLKCGTELQFLRHLGEGGRRDGAHRRPRPRVPLLTCVLCVCLCVCVCVCVCCLRAVRRRRGRLGNS